MDSGSALNNGVFVLTDFNGSVPQIFGQGWEAASASRQIAQINEAFDYGYYYFMFDRLNEMGSDTILIKKDAPMVFPYNENEADIAGTVFESTQEDEPESESAVEEEPAVEEPAVEEPVVEEPAVEEESPAFTFAPAPEAVEEEPAEDTVSEDSVEDTSEEAVQEDEDRTGEIVDTESPTETQSDWETGGGI